MDCVVFQQIKAVCIQMRAAVFIQRKRKTAVAWSRLMMEQAVIPLILTQHQVHVLDILTDGMVDTDITILFREHHHTAASAALQCPCQL
jgi:hypothetical protein